MKILFNKFRFLIKLINSREFKFCALLLTNRCNIHCEYCSVPNNSITELPTEKWFSIIRHLSKLGASHFNLLGGEPLLRSDLLEIVNFISQSGSGATLTTNGLLLNEDLIQELSSAGLFMLIISLDGYDGLSYKSDLNDVINKMRCAVNFGIIPVVHSVVTSKNIKIIPHLAKKITEQGIIFSCSLYQSVSGMQSKNRIDLVPKFDETQFTFTQLEKLKRKTGLVKTSYSYINNYKKYHSKKWKCNTNQTKWVCVQSNGKLMVCAEWETEIDALDLDFVSINYWNKSRGKAIEKCSGCYYECYYSEEEISSLKKLLQEIPLKKHFWLFTMRIIKNNIFRKSKITNK